MDFYRSASGAAALHSQVYVIYVESGGCSREANVLNKAEMYRSCGQNLILKMKHGYGEMLCCLF